MTIFLFLFIFSYIAGSINFSILIFKILGIGDPRDKFSRNAGATNVYRQAGLSWAILVFLLDMSRAIGVALISLALLEPHYVPLIGFGLILGNRFPCFHGFKGGKGVANYFGFTTALTPFSAIIGGLLWIAVNAILRVPFIASFCMVLVLAVGTMISYSAKPLAIVGALFTAMLIFISHKKNVAEWLQSKKTS